MTYATYRRLTRRLVAAIGGHETSLAGGFYGALLPVDGANLILALDDNDSTVSCWLENGDGDMVSGYESITWSPRDPGSTTSVTRRALAELLPQLRRAA